MAAAEGRDAVIECVPQQEATRRIARRYGFVCEGLEGDLLVYRLRRG